MADGTKKISFGFSKLSKQALLPKPKRVDHENNIQYIDCVESKSIKVKSTSVKEEEVRELVIPVRGKRSSADTGSSTKFIRQEKSVGKNDFDCVNSSNNSVVPESLDTIAAREIIEDLERKKVEKVGVLTLPLVEETKGVSDRAPTLDDYESIPVTDFGMAMLRGMGWSPGKGIGKNEKLAPSSAAPVLRPKGMGLGADQLASSPVVEGNDVEEEELKVFKGAFVKVTAGIHKDLYGQVEGFDENGRIIVKSALGKTSVLVLECIVKVVPESEYKRQARVLNLSQYEELKRKERKDAGIRTDNCERRRTDNE
ncbi:G-patch domain and KOW motifs-containing protein [Anabrus simplex]|uniref:G-patch domain and KOW motifs-containing protein n=1 Tax=Anabrus simplex TaxID=316456 RepID=UPI0035A30623